MIDRTAFAGSIDQQQKDMTSTVLLDVHLTGPANQVNTSLPNLSARLGSKRIVFVDTLQPPTADAQTRATGIKNATQVPIYLP